MFRITEDPSSGSLVQCLAKNYNNDYIVSVDMYSFGYFYVDSLWKDLDIILHWGFIEQLSECTDFVHTAPQCP